MRSLLYGNIVHNWNLQVCAPLYYIIYYHLYSISMTCTPAQTNFSAKYRLYHKYHGQLISYYNKHDDIFFFSKCFSRMNNYFNHSVYRYSHNKVQDFVFYIFFSRQNRRSKVFIIMISNCIIQYNNIIIILNVSYYA